MDEKLKTKVKKVDGREMLSLVRGAFAFQDRVFLYLDNVPIDCTIIAFNDADLRNTNIDRDIEVTLPKTLFHSSTAEGQDVTLEIISGANKLRLASRLTSIRSASLIIQLPKEGELIQSRDTSRFSMENQGWADGLISSENSSVPCVFKVSDFSSSGIGLTAVTSEALQLDDHKMTIEGDAFTQNYHFKGPYKILRVKLLKSAENFFEYSLGLNNALERGRLTQTHRAGRHEVNSTLTLLVNASNTKLTVTLSDVSASGFRASVQNKALPGLARDLIATETTSNIKFKISRIFETGQAAFQLISQTPNDQIRWLNLIMPFLSNGRIDVNVADSRKLVDLFFEAGASIVDGLEYKRFRLTQEDALSLLTEQSDVLLRWVNISDSGSILGHHSTYRIGMNAWYTGDVVGGQTEANKVDRSFFNDNFRILKETMECFGSQQKILGSWKPKHPYWQEWRNYLIDNKLTYCMKLCDSVARHQIKIPDGLKIAANNKSFLNLEGKELFDEIANLDPEYQWFLGALDLFSTGDSSNATKEIYLRNGHEGYRRVVKKLILNGNEYLVLLSQLPPGIAINPNFDSAFVFPKNDHSLTCKERDDLYATVVLHASRLGYRLSALRYFSESVEYTGTATEFFVIDSKGLGVFK